MNRHCRLVILLCAGSMAAPSAWAQARPMGVLNLPGLGVPAIQSVDTSGAVLDIKGANLGPGKPKVTFNGASQTVTVVSASEVTVPAPTGVAAGTYLLVLTTQYGNTASFPVAMGAQGATGPQGPQGPAGNAGPAGPMGPIGMTGPAGSPGATGPQGAKGDVGATGATGLQGPIGLTGQTGPAGPKGDTGAMGATGPQGLQGLQGPAGPTGLTGPQGLAGVQGPEGPQGLVGSIGDPGPQGIPGPQGLQGPVAPAISTLYQGQVATGSVKAVGLHYIICLYGVFPSRDGGSSSPDPVIGEVTMFAGNFAPSGWAFCDGQLLAISQNSALFSILGTTYGGDGQTTFALPDLRAAVPMEPNY